MRSRLGVASPEPRASAAAADAAGAALFDDQHDLPDFDLVAGLDLDSVTLPATVDGTSIVALSVSSSSTG